MAIQTCWTTHLNTHHTISYSDWVVVSRCGKEKRRSTDDATTHTNAIKHHIKVVHWYVSAVIKRGGAGDQPDKTRDHTRDKTAPPRPPWLHHYTTISPKLGRPRPITGPAAGRNSAHQRAHAKRSGYDSRSCPSRNLQREWCKPRQGNQGNQEVRY